MYVIVDKGLVFYIDVFIWIWMNIVYVVVCIFVVLGIDV